MTVFLQKSVVNSNKIHDTAILQPQSGSGGVLRNIKTEGEMVSIQGQLSNKGQGSSPKTFTSRLDDRSNN
jgi:hypothetical protein